MERPSWFDELNKHEGSCGYYADRSESLLYTYENDKISVSDFLKFGFRRSEFLWYRAECPHCRNCLPYRLPLANFEWKRRFKRILKKNQDVTLKVVSPHLTEEKKQIYLDYQYRQHFLRPVLGKEKEDFDASEQLYNLWGQMYSVVDKSVELELWVEDKLLGFSIFDLDQKNLSAVYSVYRFEEKHRSPGFLMILKAIEWAISEEFMFLYLGLYIHGHPKMEYKASFQPAEILDLNTNRWIPFAEMKELET